MWVECWGKQALIFFHQSFPSSPLSPSKTTPAPHFLETMEPVSLQRWLFLIWVFRSHLVVGDWQQKQKMFCFSALYVLLFRTSQLENRWGWWLRRRRKRWNLKIFAGLSQAGRSEVGHLRKWIWGLLSLWVGFYKWWSSGSENQFNKQWSAHLHYLLHICPLICNEQENKKKMWESFESRKSFVSIGDQQSAWSPWWVNIEHWTLNSEQWTVNSEEWQVNSEQWPVTSEQWTVNSEQWAVNSEQWTVNSEHCKKLFRDGLTLTYSAFRFPHGDKSSVQGFQF